MPNDGSPYPRDFVIDQAGIIRYANNEIDTEWMLEVIDTLIVNNGDNGLTGDINLDGIVNILDVIVLVNFVTGVSDPSADQVSYSDINLDGTLNILDIVSIINIILA